jgi:hypothetical protein
MRGGADREPKPLWARGEAIESMVAVGLVCMIAIGFALVLSTISGGWLAPLVGLAVAIGGSVLAVVMAPRRSEADPRRANAKAA